MQNVKRIAPVDYSSPVNLVSSDILTAPAGMRRGKSLQDFSRELLRLQANTRDFRVPPKLLDSVVSGSPADLNLRFMGTTYAMTTHAHHQLAGYADVPYGYYNRLRGENLGLLRQNVEHGLDTRRQHNGRAEARMVRTIDGTARAVLSCRYLRLDYPELVQACLPAMLDAGLEIVDCEVTETRMYMKALSPRLRDDVRPGDVVHYGLSIQSSDVGAGTLRISPMVCRLVCFNGLILPTAIKKFHVGGRNGSGDSIEELLTDETRELVAAAFFAQARDVISASLKPEAFQSVLQQLRAAAGQHMLKENPEEVVELSMRATGFTGDTLKHKLLNELANGQQLAGYTKWGLVNAFTAVANHRDIDYDQATELQHAGGAILELSDSAWRRLAC